MTVRNSAKGITVIGSSAITVADTRVEDIGEEAIHLRSNTTDSTVIGNSIDNTGLMTQMYGEGVYIGTAKDNWCTYSNCEADRSDRNTVILNTISNTTAEPIEAKEGATNGLITRNSINGTGMTDHADSLIAVQSNGWVVSKNSGTNSPLDGLQVWEHSAGWGMNNIATPTTSTRTCPATPCGCPTTSSATSSGVTTPSATPAGVSRTNPASTDRKDPSPMTDTLPRPLPLRPRPDPAGRQRAVGDLDRRPPGRAGADR